MYGTHAGTGYLLVAFVALLVIALGFFASPLLAGIIFVVAAVFFLIGMVALRSRTESPGQSRGEGPDSRSGNARGRGSGAPVSGEG
jgi:membrane protein implicated in regulation of membrane protease activity